MAGSERVAVLGAGSTMGFPMCRNLARAGFESRAWNRSPEKADPLSEDGVVVAESAAAAARGATVVVTMLADTDAVIASIGSVLGEVGCSRSSTRSDRRRCGSARPATGSGSRWWPTAGCSPSPKAARRRSRWPRDSGSTRRLLVEAVDGGPLDLPYLRMKGKAILEHSFEPMFKLALAAKDAGLITESAAEHGLDLPLFATIRDRMLAGSDAHGEEDMIATWFTSAPAGVQA